jgi:hypothetical protein
MIVMKGSDFRNIFQIIFKVPQLYEIPDQSTFDKDDYFRLNKPNDIQHFQEKCFIDFGTHVGFVLQIIQGESNNDIYFDPLQVKLSQSPLLQLANLFKTSSIIPKQDKPFPKVNI